MKSITGYFDANATTPLCDAARQAWLEADARHWHNPSSLYPSAAAAREQMEDARWRLAETIGGEPETLVFTSGATESNNALFRALAKLFDDDDRLAVSGFEHPAVSLPAQAHFGPRAERLPVTPTGLVCLHGVASCLNAKRPPRLVSVMAANNETGVLQPWQTIARMCADAGVWFHCDASQWLGKMPAEGLADCTFVTGSSHKFGGPKGVGFLKLPDQDDGVGRNWTPVLQHGGAQEDNRRAGTEDVAGTRAMVAALQCRNELVQSTSWRTRRSAWRDTFEQRVRAAIEEVAVLGAESPRLWNTSMLVLPQVRNVKWLTRLAKHGFMVSTGSACSAGAGNPSSVLASMGVDPAAMSRVLRFSSLWETTAADWKNLADALIATWHELRED